MLGDLRREKNINIPTSYLESCVSIGTSNGHVECSTRRRMKDATLLELVHRKFSLSCHFRRNDDDDDDEGYDKVNV